jgi:hypothetical protein
VFIIVKIDNLKELSNEIPEIDNNEINKNKDIIKIITDKKYLLISSFLKLMSKNKCRLTKTFLGLTCEIKSLIENLNKVKIFKNLIPELVEKKDPPIITKIKNKNERPLGDVSNEIPIFEILLVKDKKITLKL